MNILKTRFGLPLGLIAASMVTSVFPMAVSAAATLDGSGMVEEFTFDASKSRKYKVYVPQSYDGSTPVPMIMALHGCSMSNTDALNAWNLDAIADQYGVILVFPYVGDFVSARYDDCWGYWMPKHIQEGGGGEVDYIHDVALEVESRYLIDEDRRYVTGISSGAGMAVAEAIAYNEYWTAAAPVAGTPYGDWSISVTDEIFKTVDQHVAAINAELDYERAVPMLLVQSSNDTSVQPRLMELIRDSQLTVWDADLNADDTESCTKGGVSCTLTDYEGPDGLLVRTMIYAGGPGRTAKLGDGHYWTGGDDDLSIWSADPHGPNTAEQMWSFFEDVSGKVVNPECTFDSIAPAAPTGLAVVEPHDNYASLSVDGNSEADLAGYKVYRVGGSQLTRSPIASTSLIVSGLVPESSYNVYATAVDRCGNESGASSSVSFETTVSECVSVDIVATATEHYTSGRLSVSQYIDMGQKIGFIDAFPLWQRADGSWTDGEVCGGSRPVTPTPTVTPGVKPKPIPGGWSSDQNLGGMNVHTYIPNSTTANGKRALMITLHGCLQNNKDVRDGWAWADEADEYGMVVAAPMAPAGISAGCWDYYGSGHSASNLGRHDDNLVDLANKMMANTSLNIDPAQVYISGLSSGGGETFVMGCLRPDIFAGIGINAGPALGTSSSLWVINNVPIGTTPSSVAKLCTSFSNTDSYFETQLTSVVHGNSDNTVTKDYAAVDAGAMAIVYGVNKDGGTNSIAGGGTEETWSDSRGTRVSKIMVNRLGHAWPAGKGSSGGGQFTDHRTLDYPAFLSKFFFENNRRVVVVVPTPTPIPTPTPVVTPFPGTPTPTPVITPTPTPVVTVTPTPTPTPIITPTPTPVVECEEVATSNYYHKVAGRATSSGSYWSPSYVASGSGDAMPGSTWGNATLRTFDGGTIWSVGACQ